jgi:hypothetical protein
LRPSAATAGAGILAAILVLALLALVATQPPDSATLVGIGLGAGLGLVNLAAGWFAIGRALRRSTRSAFRTVVVGFLLRLAALVACVLWFQRETWVDATAFALAFMAFFYLFLLVEVRLVMRSAAAGRAA